MIRYLAGRVGQALLVLMVTFTAAFLLLQALPGDAIMIKFMSPDMALNAEQIAEIRAAYGADLPIWERYFNTLANFLTGNFGYSIQAGVPVSQQLRVNLPPTLELASLGFLAAILLTIAIAALSNVAGMAWLRTAFQSLPSLFISVPVFWLGIMLILVVSVQLGWLPPSGYVPLTEDWRQSLATTIMPAFVLGNALAAVLMRHTRSAMLTALEQDYVRTARA